VHAGPPPGIISIWRTQQTTRPSEPAKIAEKCMEIKAGSRLGNC